MSPGTTSFLNSEVASSDHFGALVTQAIADAHNLELKRSLANCLKAIEMYPVLVEASNNQTPSWQTEAMWRAHNLHGYLLDDAGNIDESVDAHRRALRFAEGAGFELGICYSITNLALELLRQGNATDAVAVTLHPFKTSDQKLQAEFDGFMQHTLANIYLCCGLIEEGRHCLSKSIEHLSPSSPNLVWPLAETAFLAFSQGEDLAFHQAMSRLAEHAHSARAELYVSCLSAIALALDGKVDEGLSRLDQLPRDRVYGDLSHPDLVAIEILARAGRWQDLLVELELQQGTPIGDVAQTWTADRITQALIALERWQDAADAARVAEEQRSRFDINAGLLARLTDDSNRAVTLRSPLEPDGDRGSHRRWQRVWTMLAHDIRNFLGTLVLGVDVAAMAADERDRGRYLECLRAISAALERVDTVPLNIDAYLKIDADYDQTDLAAHRLADVVDDVIARCSYEASTKDIEIKRRPSLDCRVQVDPGLLTVSLLNLVGNAIKFSPAGSTVSILWDQNPFDATKVDLTIRDQGPGLTAEDQQRIFADGGTLSATATANEASSGIGLYIVRRAISAMGGTISAHNNDGGGAAFVLGLTTAVLDRSALVLVEPSLPSPQAEPRAAATGPNSARPPGMPPTKVLVVDDNVINLDLAAAILGDANTEVSTATNYDTAFRLLTTNQPPFDLVILDIMLDGSPEGLDLADLAAATNPSAKTVLVTGLTVELQSSLGARIEGYEVLRKPLRSTDLDDLRRQARAQSVAAPTLSETPAVGQLGRLRILREVAKGRSLPESTLSALADSTDPAARAVRLVLDCVRHQTAGRLRSALSSGRAAEDMIRSLERPPRGEVQWHLATHLGITLVQLGKLDEAIDALTSALDICSTEELGAPDKALSLINLGDALGRAGRHSEAVALLVGGAELVGPDPLARARVHSGLGRYLLRQGAVRLAITQFLEALETCPQSERETLKSTLADLSVAYLEVRDHESLAVVAKRLDALARQTDFSRLEIANLDAVRAAVTLSVGRPAEALALSKRCLSQLGDDTAGGYGDIAVVTAIESMIALGDDENVQRQWAKKDSIVHGALGPRVHLAVAATCERLGDFEAAVHHSQQAFTSYRNRNLGLPSLVELALELRNRSDDLAAELWSDLPADLAGPKVGRSIARLLDLITNLREKIVGERDSVESGGEPDIASISNLVDAIRGLVLDLTSEDAQSLKPAAD